MSFVGFPSRNHPQQTRGRDRSQLSVLGDTPDETDAVDDRTTPPEVFDPLHERHGFTVDVAASAKNARLPRFIDQDGDGLARSWAGERVWCNPPYSNIRPWVEKAWAEHRTGCPLIVMLLPANRCEQAWWQDLIEPFRDRGAPPLATEFLRGRLRFIAPGKTGVGPNERPPFGAVLLTWRGV